MMIVISDCSKILCPRRELYLGSLFVVLILGACSDSAPTSSLQQDSATAAPAVPPSIGVEDKPQDGLGLPPAVVSEGLRESSQVTESEISSELDQAILKSLNKLSNKQNQNIEVSSVNELEKLSEADRQTLQAIAAEQTMTAAEQLAAKQVDKAASSRPVEK